MVDLGADLCVAFANPCKKQARSCPKSPHPSHGTMDCASKALWAGIPTDLVYSLELLEIVEGKTPA
jgi:hypothetical protein